MTNHVFDETEVSSKETRLGPLIQQSQRGFQVSLWCFGFQTMGCRVQEVGFWPLPDFVSASGMLAGTQYLASHSLLFWNFFVFSLFSRCLSQRRMRRRRCPWRKGRGQAPRTPHTARTPLLARSPLQAVKQFRPEFYLGHSSLLSICCPEYFFSTHPLSHERTASIDGDLSFPSYLLFWQLLVPSLERDTSVTEIIKS